MKKFMFVVFVCGSCIVVNTLLSSTRPSIERSKELLDLRYPYRKIGPSDSAIILYMSRLDNTTFGQLANFSDIIAIGRVVTQDWSQVIINVETALVGCTNGQPVTIKLWPEDNPEKWQTNYKIKWREIKHRFPTNDALIMFSAYSNETFRARPVKWSDEPQPVNEPLPVRRDYRWYHNDRSWWYTDRDNGVLLDHYTNIVHTMRVERNWTNYVHLCRDGNFKDSIRVREDSFYNLLEFIKNADANQANYIFNDPLIMPELKEYLFEKHPHLKPKEQ